MNSSVGGADSSTINYKWCYATTLVTLHLVDSSTLAQDGNALAGMNRQGENAGSYFLRKAISLPLTAYPDDKGHSSRTLAEVRQRENEETLLVDGFKKLYRDNKLKGGELNDVTTVEGIATYISAIAPSQIVNFSNEMDKNNFNKHRALTVSRWKHLCRQGWSRLYALDQLVPAVFDQLVYDIDKWDRLEEKEPQQMDEKDHWKASASGSNGVHDVTSALFKPREEADTRKEGQFNSKDEFASIAMGNGTGSSGND